MSFWTIQDKKVLDIALYEDCYWPDFDESNYLRMIPELRPLYEKVLECFNENNETHLFGLVFAFAKNEGMDILSFDNMDDFLLTMDRKRDVVGPLLKQLMLQNPEPMLLELEYSASFNPIFIDFNDFQYLMPPPRYVPPYTAASVYRILDDLENGRISRSEFPSGLIQAHLPYITRNTLVSYAPLTAFRDCWTQD